MQRPRTGHIRTVALSAVVGLCLVVPLAAASADSAGSSDPGKKRPLADATASTRPGTDKSAEFGNGVGDRDKSGTAGLLELIGGKSTTAPTTSSGAATSSGATTRPATPVTSAPSTDSVCGRPIDGPKGIRAQTCVERDGSEVWGRVYYRNPTPDPLLLAMSVLQPGGNALRVTCSVEPKETEGRCDSPRVRAPKGTDGWSALAELASKDGATKLLRSGSTTAQR
ncbi:hypothetical protein [Streptomyces sp. SID3343]|uniref:hypothetical protein n=1 Tax=Streptomyces sp. SID3343 TaxID=2690260 RepID=UPI0013691756|nr:hypothetical protein [Streptomyces sp. SID3343]MYW05059.1 hypothetical protein [Streptomyces sp. SID3343]